MVSGAHHVSFFGCHQGTETMGDAHNAQATGTLAADIVLFFRHICRTNGTNDLG